MDIEKLKELRAILERNSELEDEQIETLWELIDTAIDRQSVKSKEVQSAIEVLECIYPSQKEIATGEYPQVADVLDLAIAALQEYQPWVKVSEGLPGDMDDYLIVIKHKYPSDKEWQYVVDVASSSGTYLDGFWDTWNDWDEGQELHVTHWMRMPEPPQREEQT